MERRPPRSASLAVTLGVSLLIAASCNPQLPPPTAPPGIGESMGKVVVRLIGQSSSETSDVDAGRAAGRLFLVTMQGEKIAWSNCGNVIVPYGWRPSDKHIEHVDAQNESELHAKLPFAASMSFGTEFSQGNRIRVWIASAGAYHVDESQLRIPAGCKATHYVSTITVGAYSIVSVSAAQAEANVGISGVGGGGHAGERRLQGSEQGELDKCSGGGDSSGPPDACKTPVEILLAPIDRSMITYDVTVPVGATTVGPSPTPSSVPKDEAHCAQLVKRTGDITADINALGEACGTNFGFAAVAPPYSRALSEEQEWQRQFDLELGAGCYRLLAASDAGIDDLDVEIKDESGVVLAEDTTSGPMPVLGPDGPFCIERAQHVSFWAHVSSGSGTYAMWLWKKK